jgi:hypothetical protein
MADRADVILKNSFGETIYVVRKLPDGTIDLNTMVASGSEEQIHLPSPEVLMQISAPEGIDTKDHLFNVKSDVDLAVSHSRTDSFWTLQIVSNELPPDTPTTVNVNIGEIGPG